MKEQRRGTAPGLLLGGILAAVLGGAVMLTRSRPTADAAREETAREATTADPAQAPERPVAATPTPAAFAPPPAERAGEADGDAALARSLVDRLAELLAPGRTLSADEQRESAAIQERLAALGETAAAALAGRLDARKDAPGGRELLFNVLRRLPGDAVEARLVGAAKAAGDGPAMRTMALESLAERRTDRAFAALAEVARADPELPGKALIATPRAPSDTSTELPDETVFSPRMQAMSALAGTRDPRAVDVLADVTRTGPEESLRMEAARNLEGFHDDPQAREVLRGAATSDPSAYVRLAALHALQGSKDASLGALLERIAAQDRDAGVRILAQRLLNGGR